MFKRTEDYTFLLKILKPILYEKLTFSCYSDDMITLSYYDELNVHHEFCVKSDDVILNDMTIIDLLNLNRIQYISFELFSNSVRLISLDWSLNRVSQLN